MKEFHSCALSFNPRRATFNVLTYHARRGTWLRFFFLCCSLVDSDITTTIVSDYHLSEYQNYLAVGYVKVILGGAFINEIIKSFIDFDWRTHFCQGFIWSVAASFSHQSRHMNWLSLAGFGCTELQSYGLPYVAFIT